MPIFWLVTAICGAGRTLTSSPRQKRSIEIAASWPCATAQMMFFGPNAASPPKNTFGLVEAMVVGSTFGMSHLSNSMPQSRSIQGKEFSWPTATSTSSHGKMLIRLAGRHQIAAALGVAHRLDLLEHDAGELAVVVGEFLRHQEIEDRNVLVHGVFLFPGGRLHLLEAGAHDTLTSSPPSRREERQQSIAVLPPPSTMTRLPILSMWPNETLDSQSMPIWMFLTASLRPGMSRSRPRGAPQPTKMAS